MRGEIPKTRSNSLLVMWKNCPLQLDFQLTPMTDLKGWVEHILLSWKPQVTAMALMLAWAVWNERNNVVWQGKRRSQGELVEGTMRLLDDFQRLHQPPTKVSFGIHAKWQKPPVGVIKINVKGTFRAHNGSGGGGLVARNEDGVFVAAKACFFPWVSSPAHAEALAFREALQFASDRNFNHLQMECDALEFVQSLSRTTADTSSIGALVEDCKAILALLPNSSFTHISRMANKVAFRLAQLSLTLTSASTWSWEPPVIITDALVEDSLY
ncbi:uncharacterized protein LOC110746423 [Prunus avium]|uniref:Uncharacterized protein LOC110746423 n=1 Tax=Prunus avium TaxID=42229 RepID=A0A6P5RN01_PRUAV|nr:uncharacterized protein LOC110746423 [Prunus avium]